MINNLQELYERTCLSLDNVTDDQRKTSIDKTVYNGTDCGAWITYEDDGVTVGSIVEGAERCTEVKVLSYPFDISIFWSKLTEVEAEADEIWNETHGCEKCFPKEPDNIIVNKDCTGCLGDGIII